MIEIDETASRKLKEALGKNPGKHWRLAIEGDGCAGPYYRLSLDEPGENELTAEVDGIELLISDAVKRHAELVTIKIQIHPSWTNLL
jgi:Fe-S cluster assembly iron-binding protein IscA